ncbi:hypothetical protein BURC_00228 [Burkholderiaceae bacterium]|nr:hypothetical protein BURC_00228 [Burkholderiaceae bacterium]
MNETVEPARLDTLLELSEDFEEALTACFPAGGFVLAVANPQHELVAAACALCIEHASALRAAFAVAAPSSGSAILRLQYEALLRASWLLHAATSTQIDTLARTLDLEAEQAARKLPGYMEMLDAVMKKAPQGLSAPIAEFNRYSRHALNSFVHSGIHPLSRARDGYPLEMAATLVRFSNGLMHLGYRMLASLSGSQRRMNRVTHLYAGFLDCLPTLNRDSTQGDGNVPRHAG